MIPFGILNMHTDQLYILFGHSHKTSDFICDGIEKWWGDVRDTYPDINKLVINLDNGPESSGQRTQFLARMQAFSSMTGLRVHLVYYPPYHSKYNPIERSWAVLENHWNGTLLNKVKTVLSWAKTMTWKGVKPVVHFIKKTYVKGVSLSKDKIAVINEYITRHSELPLWDITINPEVVHS